MRNKIITYVTILIFICGVILLMYPTTANWWNRRNINQSINTYLSQVANLSSTEEKVLIDEAKSYNDALISNPTRFHPTEEEHLNYINTLGVGENEMIGSIEIPVIKVNLPIYHGTSSETLSIAAGHLEGSSLPIGGLGTHAVITGHRGLPSAKLFTDLDRLIEGDYVVLKVLNQTLTYQIDTIRIVLPQEVEGLAIDPDKDLLTLVTCTPYGVNTHRMLLTGHRVENLSEWEAVSDAGQIDPKMVALFIAVPILVGLFIWLMIYYRKPGGDSDEEDKNNSNQ